MDKFDQIYLKVINEQNNIIEQGWLGKLAAGAALAAGLTAGANAQTVTDIPLPKQQTKIIQTVQQAPKKAVDNRHMGKDYTLSIAVKCIVNFEGTRKDPKTGLHVAYKDVKGVETIGYGCTDKNLVKKGKITEAEAQKALLEEINKVYEHLKTKFGKDWDVMDNFMQAGLISLYYNTGIYSKFPKLEAAIKAHNWKEAAKQFLDIDKVTKTDANGNTYKQKVNGLTIRRAKEAKKIFLFWVTYDQNVAKAKKI